MLCTKDGREIKHNHSLSPILIEQFSPVFSKHEDVNKDNIMMPNVNRETTIDITIKKQN